jgi:hypothetical protein
MARFPETLTSAWFFRRHLIGRFGSCKKLAVWRELDDGCPAG